ncbi:hypothetical protein Ahy_B03g066365 isoform B [Arachis hypogaea]|uniref:Uncharacterized protein n=1 Tax=Arachis hypogaea TaxID=3818 RepID=A0A445A3W5_ARAHY|nr:hypothetical protein Ahy_B03g066365 isoform B [Arachis hypogaea]
MAAQGKGSVNDGSERKGRRNGKGLNRVQKFTKGGSSRTNLLSTCNAKKPILFKKSKIIISMQWVPKTLSYAISETKYKGKLLKYCSCYINRAGQGRTELKLEHHPKGLNPTTSQHTEM